MNELPVLYAPVPRFCDFDRAGLDALRHHLGLTMPAGVLGFCQRQFRTREHRDPTVAELLFFDRFYALWCSMSGAPRPTALRFQDPEAERIWRDMVSKRAALNEAGAPPSLPDIMSLSAHYLSRAGLPVYDKSLFCGTKAELAALRAPTEAHLSLSLAHTAAALLPKAPQGGKENGVLVLLTPTGNAPFEEEITAFLERHREKGLTPIAAPGDEGIWPHLVALPGGVSVDLARLLGEPWDTRPFPDLAVGAHTVLFLADEALLPSLLADGASPTLIGGINKGGTFLLHHGSTVLVSCEHQFLKQLRLSRPVELTLGGDLPTAHTAPTLKKDKNRLLCGVETAGGVQDALLALVEAAFADGADLTTATMSAALVTPPLETSEAEAAALSLLLGLHRVTAELCLPSVNHRQLLCREAEHPRLALFLTARRQEVEAPTRRIALQTAVKARDFAAIRRIVFEKT